VYLLAPHSAVGVRGARARRGDPGAPIVTLATAHPAKFPEAVARSGVPREPTLPHYMADLFERPERCAVLPHELRAVQEFIRGRIA
jgi:threonine synthase